MPDRDAAAVALWLERLQAVAMDTETLSSALTTVMRFEAMARAAAEDLPFEAEPGGFLKLYEELARPRRNG